jgi:NAD(P)H dehydrogenase (quinone)
MHAPPKPDYPTITPDKLEEYDGFLFGIPTRFGNFPGQWKAFWDQTGKQWGSGGYWGKYAGVFVSSGTMGGGQESTAVAAMSTLAHHGIIYVPLGYKTVFDIVADFSEIRGGGPWGAGTFAVGQFWSRQSEINADNTQGADGSRQPTEKELEMATRQGEAFAKTVSKVNFS